MPKASPKSAAAVPATRPNGRAMEPRAHTPTTAERVDPSQTAARLLAHTATGFPCNARVEPSALVTFPHAGPAEDDHGSLTDQPLDRWDADTVSEISREDLQHVWDS